MFVSSFTELFNEIKKRNMAKINSLIKLFEGCQTRNYVRATILSQNQSSFLPTRPSNQRCASVHTLPETLAARVPDPQKRLNRPSLVGPKLLDRIGNPIWRLRQDTAENRCDHDLLKPLPRYDVRNRIVFPPIEETKKFYESRGEACPRIQPAFVCHSRRQIQVKPFHLRYIALLVSGLSVDEALSQLEFHPVKAAEEVKETIEEAVEMATLEHGLEFRSNMYVALAQVYPGKKAWAIKKKAKGKMKRLHFDYCDLGIMLVEGKPPPDFLPHDPADTRKKFENRLQELRSRKIHWDLKWNRVDCSMKQS